MKLTLVSVVYRGQRLSAFVPTFNGNVDMLIINDMLKQLGCTQRGLTYTIG